MRARPLSSLPPGLLSPASRNDLQAWGPAFPPCRRATVTSEQWWGGGATRLFRPGSFLRALSFQVRSPAPLLERSLGEEVTLMARERSLVIPASIPGHGCAPASWAQLHTRPRARGREALGRLEPSRAEMKCLHQALPVLQHHERINNCYHKPQSLGVLCYLP